MENNEARGDRSLNRRDFLRGALALPAALAALQATPNEALAATSSKIVKGKYWKLKLPSYWAGKVRYASSGIYPKSGRYRNMQIVQITECNASMVNTYKSISAASKTKITLRDGKKLPIRVGDDGFHLVILKVKSGKYLMIACCHYGWSSNTLGFVTKAQAKAMAKYQSLGKKKTYPTSLSNRTIPKLCLQAVARNIYKA